MGKVLFHLSLMLPLSVGVPCMQSCKNAVGDVGTVGLGLHCMLGESAILNKPRACVTQVSFLLRLILHGGSGLDPYNAIKQNGRPTRRGSCS